MYTDCTKAVVPSALGALLEAYYSVNRVLYFSAPCGAGKTTLAGALLAGRDVCAYSALELDGLRVPPRSDCDAVLIDDFQCLKDQDEQQTV